jgi:hypothetical protein
MFFVIVKWILTSDNSFLYICAILLFSICKMKSVGFQKFFKFIFITLIAVFSLVGFGLTASYVAVKMHLTDDPGVVDINDRYFQEIRDKYGKLTSEANEDIHSLEVSLFQRIAVLSKYYPENAGYILNAYNATNNLTEAWRMLEAAEMQLQANADYIDDIQRTISSDNQDGKYYNQGSVFKWMNINEWKDFKIAVAKDKLLIDSVANLTGVEPRLIVAVLVGEQIRLFNSNREAYKKWIGPLKILSVETTFSLGVTGIKVPTAQRIERNLKDTTSIFYLGKEYENLLDFSTGSHGEERFKRLTSYKNHFYSYLYAALNVKQIKVQWERSGFPIDSRPEILATLFNIGFESSVPKENPVVGGSGINIKGKKYSFGAVAYEFYYSGELFDLFPFKKSKFDFNDAV